MDRLSKLKKNIPYQYVFFGFILLLVLFCIVLYLYLSPRVKKNNIVREQGNFSERLTNPILDCEVGEGREEIFLPYKEVHTAIKSLEKKYSVTHTSVYFRDLNNGQWIGINEREEFAPASLIKIPVLLGYYAYAEKKPTILSENITILPKDGGTITQNIVPEQQTEIGKEYTVEELLNRSIRYSDNTATNALRRHLPTQYFAETFERIGVPLYANLGEIELRVKDYASFFRVLFNASYLTREYSEQALKLLSTTAYKDGIVAGVPKDTVVAHKFGERKTLSGAREDIQLHDCGIVYYPDMPYLLCVMTRGTNIEDQTHLIRDISKYFYTEVEKNT